MHVCSSKLFLSLSYSLATILVNILHVKIKEMDESKVNENVKFLCNDHFELCMFVLQKNDYDIKKL